MIFIIIFTTIICIIRGGFRGGWIGWLATPLWSSQKKKNIMTENKCNQSRQVSQGPGRTCDFNDNKQIYRRNFATNLRKKSYQTSKNPSFCSDASFLLTKQSSAKI